MRKKGLPAWYKAELVARTTRAKEINAGATLTAEELAMLQSAARHRHGEYMDGSPRSGYCDTMAEAGLFDVIEPSGFHGGVYRITEAGRALERKLSPPEWWD